MEEQQEQSGELQVIVIGKIPSDAAKLTTAYGEMFMFTEYDFRKTLHKAIQTIAKNDYDICFISDCYAEDEIASFVGDYEKLDKANHCAMVQYRKELDTDFDRTSLQDKGLMAIVSLQGLHNDKLALAEAIKCDMHELEVRKRKVDVKGAIDVALRELDKIARERKRGKNKSFNTIAVDFISLNTEFDEEILDKYYTELESKTETAEPEKVDTVQIPDDVLAKDLPHLDEKGYEGASHRVWKKLLNKYGKDSRESETQVARAEEEVTPTEPAETAVVEPAAGETSEPPPSEEVPVSSE